MCYLLPQLVYPTGVSIIARNDRDIKDGGGVGHGQERKQNGKGEESYPMIKSVQLVERDYFLLLLLTVKDSLSS